MAVVTYWGHMLGINIETEMRRKAFDHLQKLSFGFFDNQKTGHLVGRAHQGPGGDRRGRPPRAGGSVHRGDDARRRLRPDVRRQGGTRADRRLRGAADGLAHDALRRPHDRELARALWPRRRLQRAHRGERRRHPRGAGLRQRGPRAPPLRARQPQLSRDQAGGLPHHGGLHLALLLQHAAHPDDRAGGGQLVRAARRSSRPAASSPFCCSSACSSARSTRSTR